MTGTILPAAVWEKYLHVVSLSFVLTQSDCRAGSVYLPACVPQRLLPFQRTELMEFLDWQTPLLPFVFHPTFIRKFKRRKVE
jgi:hypothetical protein